MKAVQPVYQQAPVRSVSRARAFWRIAMTMAALASLSVAVQGALPDLSPVKVTEIHYHPANPSEVEAAINGAWQDGDFEFLELRNTSGSALDLSGAYFEGITFTFPAGTSIGAQGYLVLARNAAAFAARNPGISVAGVYQGNLANEGERITFRRSDAQRVFFVDYDDALPWPVWAASFGHSLININLTDNPNIPQNWRASPFKHGSPAAGDPGPAYGTEVIINEVLSRPSGPNQEAAVELYNPTDFSVDISDWFLSNTFDPADPKGPALRKFRVPPATLIAPRSYKVFYAAQLATGPDPVTFDPNGGAVYLASANGRGDLTGYITGQTFGPAEAGIPFGPQLTTAGADFWPRTSLTFSFSPPADLNEFRQGPGTPNTGPILGPVVISELMYNPAGGGTEFVELYNLTASTIDLSSWELGGTGFTFPAGATISGNGYLLLIDTETSTVSQFRTTYGVPAAVPIYGAAFGLDNDGEAIELRKPNAFGGPSVLVDRVRYGNTVPWPDGANGSGPSIQRFCLRGYGNEPSNWRAAGGTPGAGHTLVNSPPSISNILDASGSEDGSWSIIPPFSINDPDTPYRSWRVTAASSNPSLVRGETISFLQFPGFFRLRFDPEPNASGTTTITVTVDDGCNSVSDTFQLVLSPQNDPPSYIKGPDQYIVNSSGPVTVPNWATAISPGPSDESAQSVSFIIIHNSNAALFQTAPAVSSGGTLTFTPAAGVVGTAFIGIRLRDSAGADDPGLLQFFSITVYPATPVVGVTANPTVVTEGGAGTTFFFNRQGAPIDYPLNVEFSIPESGQMADLVDAPGLARRSVTIPSGSASTSLALTAVDDAYNTGSSKPVSVILKSSPTYSINGAQASAQVLIQDNDVTPAPSTMQWPGVFNPWRMQRIDVRMSAADWGRLNQDGPPVLPHYDAEFLFDDGQYKPIRIWSRGDKPASLRVDFNERVDGQSWRGLEKLNLHAGDGILVEHGLASYLHAMAAGLHGYEPGRAAFVDVYINDVWVGAYLSVESFDDQFVKNRGMHRENSTWVYKSNPTERVYPDEPPDSPTFSRIGGNAMHSDSVFEAYFDIDNLLTLVSVDALFQNYDNVLNDNNVNRVDFYFPTAGYPNSMPITARKDFHVARDLDDVHFSGFCPPFTLVTDDRLTNPRFKQRHWEIMQEMVSGTFSEPALVSIINRLQFMLMDRLQPARDFYVGPDCEQDIQTAAHRFDDMRNWAADVVPFVQNTLSPRLAPLPAKPVFSRSDNTVTMTTSTADAWIWYTTDGSDPWPLDDSAPDSAKPHFESSSGSTLLPGTRHIVARARKNGKWSHASRQTFVVADDANALVISELMYRPPEPTTGQADAGYERDDFEFIELQNTGASSIDLSEHYFEAVAYTFPPGSQIAAGQRFILNRNPRAFEVRHPGRPHHAVYWDGKLKDTGETLALHAPDGSVALSLTYQGLSALKVTEIHYHPANPSAAELAINPNWTDDDFEFLELKNTGTTPLDLSGCHFTDGIDYTFPSGAEILPGAFLILVRSPTAFAVRYPDVAFQGVYTGRLDNGGERLKLETSDEVEIIDVTYDDSGAWPGSPDGGGPSLVNANPAGDPNLAGNWRASIYTHGSPGTEDVAATATYLNTDATTRGNWMGRYGSQGYVVIADATYSPNARTIIPGGITWIWPSSPYVGGLQRVANPGETIQACLHSPDYVPNGAFEVRIDFYDAAVHQLALYILDWDANVWQGPRTERIEILDGHTGNLLGSRTIGSAERGKYLLWNVRGQVRVRVSNLNGINAVLSGIFFDPNNLANPGEQVWVNEAADLAGAQLYGDGEPWSWIANPRFAGNTAHQSSCLPWVHQHYFTQNPVTITPEPDDELFCWVYVDPACPPTMVMLQWLADDGSWWHHRAIWGTDQSPWGVSGTASRWRVSTSVPAAGQWVRLAVPAYQVSLVGRKVSGMAYTLAGGKAVWDYAGKQSGLPDTDSDGLPDQWELTHFGSLAQNATGDPDGDGAINFQELQRNSNPNNPNTDGDLFNNGSPFTDGQEIYWLFGAAHTDPSLSDTDADGLSDTQEIDNYWTDPTHPNTDGDCLSDGQEVLYYNTDPLIPNNGDTDGDGLSDCDEINTHYTDPNDPDSDDDGLSDGAEVNQYGTYPWDPDSDWDGWSDYDEVLVYGTNPLDYESHP